MEGPTPSTAIFYGSLSVHIGAFLLFRTYPLWEYQYSVRIVIAGVGLTTAVVSTCIARVQSSVKSQIAYASAAQIGLIFIEVAAGLQSLALMHFAGNAFLRTYQLLVSPSVVSYLIKEQFYHFVKPEKQFRSNWVKRLNYTVYLWSIKEFNLDWFMYRFLWGALKSLGRFLSYFRIRNALIVYSAVLTGGVFMLYHQEYIPSFLENYMSVLLATLALVLVLRSFVERKSVLLAWLLIMLSHGFIVLSVLFNEFFEMQHSLVYLSGVLLAGIGGLACYFYLKSHEVQLGLNQFYGLTAKYKKTAFVFLLCCLGISGFPITPTFIGEDLVLSHVHQNQLLLAFILSVNLIVGGITVLRIYTRIFLGSFIHQQEDAALRSA